MIQTKGVIAVTALIMSSMVCGAAEKPLGAPSAEAIGWRMGMQAYSFREFTFFEAVDKTASLGLHSIEIFPNQSLSKEKPDVKTKHTMSPETMEEIRKKLAEAGVRAVNYGVIKVNGNAEADWREVFDWAAAMGIETIVSEPPEDALPLLDKLCGEYKVNLAIHNHPKPSHYWNPETILAACEGRSDRIGACADTGHWMRSGINPVDALKMLEGRIISFHFKDLNQYGKKGSHDVPWGTGAGNAGEILAEIHRQGIEAVFSSEYEHNWENSLPELAQCVKFFNDTAEKLSGRSQGNWKGLFIGKDLSQWQKPNGDAPGDGWVVREDGALVLEKKAGTIWSKEQFGNFILDLEFHTDGNSGVFFRTDNIKSPVQNGIEVQVLDPGREIGKHSVGALYDLKEPTEDTTVDGWNHAIIVAEDSKISILMNGTKIIDADLEQWNTPRKNPDGTKNKFKKALRDFKREGHIGLQDHKSTVRFRNIRIKPL